MKILLLSALPLLLFGINESTPTERLENWQIFQDVQAPSLQVLLDKNIYLPGEAIVARCILSNPYEKKIPIHSKILERGAHSFSLGICEEKEVKDKTRHCYSIGKCSSDCVDFGKPVYLEPGESLYADFIVGSLTSEAKEYYLLVSYYWRECDPKTASTEEAKCHYINANPLPFSIVDPKDSELEAMKYIQIPHLLNFLQTPLYNCTRFCGKVKDLPCEDTPEFYTSQGRKFLERFPKSAYSRYMNYTLGIILKDQKNYQAAEEQMGKFISLYPGDWMVDDAMFEMAECQIEQGKPDKAQATLESLFQQYPLTSAHQAKRVLENLKKGYKSMGQIYGH